MDPLLWKDVLAAASGKIADRFPECRAQIEIGAGNYEKRLKALDASILRLFAAVPLQQRTLVTSHDAFGYFGRRYDLEVMALQGISTDRQISVGRVDALVEQLIAKKVRAVFTESSVSRRDMRAVIEGAAERGWQLRIGGTLFSDAMGAAGTETATYIGMLTHNVGLIANSFDKKFTLIKTDTVWGERLSTGQPRPSIVRCRQLRVAYEGKDVLSGVNCELPAGQRIAVVGPNGAGKSTFVKALLGLLPHKGRIEINVPASVVVYAAQRQDIDWDFPVTVSDVALMGLYAEIGWFRPVRAAHRRAVLRALETVGIAHLAKRSLSALSVGQQQRVFLARALINRRATFFLFDEPFAGVDMRTAAMMHAIFRTLTAEGKTVLCVHHELNTVLENFDYTLLLAGRLIAAGETADVLAPRHLATAYGVPLTMAVGA